MRAISARSASSKTVIVLALGLQHRIAELHDPRERGAAARDDLGVELRLALAVVGLERLGVLRMLVAHPSRV